MIQKLLGFSIKKMRLWKWNLLSTISRTGYYNTAIAANIGLVGFQKLYVTKSYENKIVEMYKFKSGIPCPKSVTGIPKHKSYSNQC